MSSASKAASVESGWDPHAHHGLVHVAGDSTLPARHAVQTGSMCGKGKGGKPSARHFAWAEAHKCSITCTDAEHLPKTPLEFEEHFSKGSFHNHTFGVLVLLHLPSIKLKFGKKFKPSDSLASVPRSAKCGADIGRS